MAAGARVVDGVKLRRRYGKADAGRRCTICDKPLVKALEAAGETTHPTCGDPYDECLEALTRTLRKRGSGENDTPGTVTTGANGSQPAPLSPHPPLEDTPLPEPDPLPADPSPVAPPPSSPGTISDRQLRKLHVSLAEAGVIDREDKLAFCRDTVYRPGIESTRDLSLNEAKQVIDRLERLLNPPT